MFALFLLQTAAPASPSASFLTGVLPIVLMLAIFYFLVFMPMRRQQKNQREMIKALAAGQMVVTTGGIVGTIMAVYDDTLILRIKPDSVKLEIARSAVTSVVNPDQPVKPK